ncbi:MAG: flagellar hook-length control protein FliK [Novosphingobium sp.]|nr:flagellar hook-length control protein FliK [Novosphingobium sp.]
MPVSVNSLFPMAAGAGGAVSSAPAADSLAGGFTSAGQAKGSFQSLLGAAQAASTTTASPSSAATAPGAAQSADLLAAAPPPVDTLVGEATALPQIAAETPVQDAIAAQTKGPSAKPTEAAHAVAADHIKPQVATGEPILPQLVKQAASSEPAAPTADTETSDADATPAKDDAEAPVAKHGEGDASAIVLAVPTQTSQASPNAAMAGAASIQPQLAATPQDVHDVAAADAAKGSAEGFGKVSSKLGKAGGPAASTPFEGAAQESAGSRSQGAGQGGTTSTAATVDAAPDQGSGSSDASLSAPLFSQTLAGTASRPGALPYTPTAHSAPQSATVSVQQGQFGNDIGVEIARALDKGGDDLLIRLDPRHMGRIDVRLSFDHDGVLRAVLSADSASSLDMLRRESTDLNRALADAGVRSDGQSLRFDSRSGGQGSGQRWQGDQQGQQQAGLSSRGGLPDGFGGSDDPIYRSLRGSGHVDLMA